MAKVIRFEPIPPAKETLKASLDLADLAGRWLQAAATLQVAAGRLLEAHAADAEPIAAAFHDGKRAAGDVFVALVEFGNAAVMAAHIDALATKAVADAAEEFLPSTLTQLG